MKNSNKISVAFEKGPNRGILNFTHEFLGSGML